MTTTIESIDGAHTGQPNPHPTTPVATPRVTAVVVVRDGAPWLSRCLDAIAGQTRAPDQLVVLDLSSTDDSAAIAAGHDEIRHAVDEIHLITGPAGATYADAIARALAAATGHDEFVWLVHDDSVPRADVLHLLLAEARRSARVGIVGPKVVLLDDERRLVDIGTRVTRAGRRIDEPYLGERDQGQYDTRTDVLAVGTSGMLVRRSMYDALGGLDPALHLGGGELDLGWRAHLAGSRVLVVPSAVVADAVASRRGQRVGAEGIGARDARAANRALRRSARQVALMRAPALAVPLLALWMVLAAVGSSIGLLLLKQPRLAALELSDLGALAHPITGVRSRWRARATSVVPTRHVRSVFVGPADAARHTWDLIRDLTTRGSRRPTGPVKGAEREGIESGPVAEEAEDLNVLGASLPQRIVTHPGLIATVVAALASGVLLRGSLRAGLLDGHGSGLAGGQLSQFTADASGLWDSYRDTWVGAGLGGPGEPGQSPALAVLAGLSWLLERVPFLGDGRSPAAVLVGWLLLAAMPLAAATAYLAGRVVTRSPWLRALGALAWAGTPVLVAAVASGRVYFALGYVLLPLVAAGVIRCAMARARTWEAFATAVAAAAAAAFVPMVLPVLVLAAVWLLIVGPGVAVRLRALVLALAPAAMLAPTVVYLAGDWRRLIAAPGLLALSGSDQGVLGGAPWWLTLGVPDDSRPLVAILMVPLAGAALAGLVYRAPTWRAAVAAASGGAFALLGLAGAVLAQHVTFGSVAAPGGSADAAGVEPAALWTGVPLMFYLAGLWWLGLFGARSVPALLRRRANRDDVSTPVRVRVWRAGAAIAVAVVAVGTVAATAVQAKDAVIGAVGANEAVSTEAASLPAVAVEQARSPLAMRLLVVHVDADSTRVEVIGDEPGEIQRRQISADPPTDPGYGAAVATLTGGPGAGASAPADALADLGVGFVAVDTSAVVPGATSTGAARLDQLTRTMDAAAGLSRLGSTDGLVLWRVVSRASPVATDAAVPVSRLRLTDPAGKPLAALDTTGGHGSTEVTVPSATAARTLVVAESPDWAQHAQVTLDGVTLQPIAAPSGRVAQAPTYPIPAAGGALVIDLEPTARTLPWAQVAALVICLFLALPSRRRTRRIR